ncbi:Hypothetical protein A7982_00161 [Minicystis rosea]|nr:Hypothetical protein A7982_00161 [Minicystis rosea]
MRGADALSIARGDVRDGVAAIEHFLQVLASRRVGPRMLARAVPEMAAGCAPLLAALTALASALSSVLADDPDGIASVRALLGHAEARVSELSAALASHEGGAMDARGRLAMEAVVRRIAGELSEVVRIIDWFGAPATSETTAIDLADALGARRGPSRPATTVVHAAVEIRADELNVGDARLVVQLLEQSVATVARAGVTAPRIVVENGPEGFPVLAVGEAGRNAVAGQLVFDAALRDDLPASARVSGVAQAAARHAGISLAIEDGGRRVTIAL